MQPELHTNTHFYEKPFPIFAKPKIIGYIGYENVMFAKTIQNKKVYIDLNLHIDKAIRKPPELDVKLTELLKFLLQHEMRLKLRPGRVLDDAHFFCYRGLLTCISCTPYERKEGWKIVAVLFKGNIYLCARDTDEKKKKKLAMTEKEIQFTSWGYKFEQSVLSESPYEDPNPDLPVDENKEFSLVFKTNLNNHSIVYGAEMDGIRIDKNLDQTQPDENVGFENIIEYLLSKEFIEVKTNRHIEFPNQERNFRLFKTKKWWCQSFLAGVNTILCGFRNDDGIVEELKVFNVNDLPKISRKYWDPSVCFNFLETFLTYVKRCLSREIKQKYGSDAYRNLLSLPLISLHFEWRPGLPVQTTNNYVYADDPILPEWFVENFMKNVQYCK
ncbi:decapping and exoribonuclease protein-like [Battus philenor]|uniref:decapping and exoribonuclease protein-like n=1 Tax=Battus philenor TaxID=42288 RepID=UPI0035D0BF75